MKTRNEAYDLDLFGGQVARPRPLADPRKEPVRAVPSPKKQQKKKARSQQSLQFWFRMEVGVFVSAFLFLAGFMIYGKVIVSETIVQIDAKQTELKYLQSEQVRLSSELEQKISLKDIEKYATQKLGMIKMNDYQVHYINTNEGDQVTISQSKKETKIVATKTSTSSSFDEDKKEDTIGGNG